MPNHLFRSVGGYGGMGGQALDKKFRTAQFIEMHISFLTLSRTQMVKEEKRRIAPSLKHLYHRMHSDLSSPLPTGRSTDSALIYVSACAQSLNEPAYQRSYYHAPTFDRSPAGSPRSSCRRASPRSKSLAYIIPSQQAPLRFLHAAIVIVLTLVPITYLHGYRNLGLSGAYSDLFFLGFSCMAPQGPQRCLSQASETTQRGQIHVPSPLMRNTTRPYFGRLALVTALPRDSFARAVNPLDDRQYHAEKDYQLSNLDKYADEADFSSSDPGRYDHYDDFDYPIPSGCYRPRWSYATHPTCNHFHEMTLDRGLVGDVATSPHRQDTLVGLVGVGHYRLSWVFGERQLQQDFVLKNLRLNKSRNYNHKTFSEIQIEALSMTETTASPLTIDLYGHCGTSVAVERGIMIDKHIRGDRLFHSLEEMDREQPDDVKPRNNFTADQKLHIAIAMAESLAELHGNPKGLIANNDVKVDQWLVTKKGLKLNDFNKARVLKWSPEKQEYCPYYSSYETMYRAPEELKGSFVDESPDVYALGKILYTLLTGLQPHYEQRNFDKAIRAIASGTAPYVDPRYRNRSMIENRLVEVMEQCWAHEPQRRPSIFEVVSQLRRTDAERLKLRAAKDRT